MRKNWKEEIDRAFAEDKPIADLMEEVYQLGREDVLGRKVSEGWTFCKDALPSNTDECIVFMRTKVGELIGQAVVVEANYENNKWYIKGMHDPKTEIIAWMPYPEPPEE